MSSSFYLDCSDTVDYTRTWHFGSDKNLIFLIFDHGEVLVILILIKRLHNISVFLCTFPLTYCRYLQEVGYTDTILDVKSQRVRALLGLAGDGGGRTGERTAAEPLVNGTETTTKSMGTRGWVLPTNTTIVLKRTTFRSRKWVKETVWEFDFTFHITIKFLSVTLHTTSSHFFLVPQKVQTHTG